MNNDYQKYIGIKFKRPNKSYFETVVDFRVTYNSKNEFVSVVFVAAHDFYGGVVTNYETPKSIIDRYLINKGGD